MLTRNPARWPSLVDLENPLAVEFLAGTPTCYQKRPIQSGYRARWLVDGEMEPMRAPLALPSHIAALRPGDSVEALIFPFEPHRWIEVGVGAVLEIITVRRKCLRKVVVKHNPLHPRS